VVVHQSLLVFETADVRAAKVVGLRFFSGLENDEIAAALAVSVATVKRDWSLAPGCTATWAARQRLDLSG
jgi:hypothetical protein